MIEHKQDMKHLLAQLNEFNWHHPSRDEEKFLARDLNVSQDYYYAQIALILQTQFQQSNRQIEYILGISRRKVGVLIQKYSLEFESFEQVMVALNRG